MRSFFSRFLPPSQPHPTLTLPSPPRGQHSSSRPTLVVSNSSPYPPGFKPTRTFSSGSGISSSSSSRRAAAAERKDRIQWLERAIREDAAAEREVLMGRRSASERWGVQPDRSGEDDDARNLSASLPSLSGDHRRGRDLGEKLAVDASVELEAVQHSSELGFYQKRPLGAAGLIRRSSSTGKM